MPIHQGVKVTLRKLFIIISFLLFGVLVFESCQSKNKYEHIKTEVPPWFSKYSFYTHHGYNNFFKSHINQFQDTTQFVYSGMLDFYKSAKPFWTSYGLQEENIHAYLNIIDSCHLHGLPKEMFQYSKIKTLYDSIVLFKIKDSETLYNILIALELELSNSYLEYAKVLSYGAFNPKTIHPQKFLYVIDTISSTFFNRSLSNLDCFTLYLDSISPKSNNYIALQKELKYYNLISDTSILDTLKHTKSYFTDKIIASLERNRWPILPKKGSDYIVVNIPEFILKAYLQDTCRVSLKICCGLPLSKNDRTKSDLKNHVYPSGKWETPLLYSYITQLVLNPEWNIPYSIMKDEYLHKLQRDNMTIIQKEKLMVYDKKRSPVTPESIDWRKVVKNNIPYTLVQPSGKHNALGIIKFDFPNPESIYLHDTPNKGAFKRKNRAVSHGCCRVENPLDLAQILFQYNELSEYEIEKIMIILGFGPSTEQGLLYQDTLVQFEVKFYEQLDETHKRYYRPLRPTKYKLQKKIPLFIEYYTCFLNEENKIQYCDDVYSKDYGIINQFKEYMK